MLRVWLFRASACSLALWTSSGLKNSSHFFRVNSVDFHAYRVQHSHSSPTLGLLTAFRLLSLSRSLKKAKCVFSLVSVKLYVDWDAFGVSSTTRAQLVVVIGKHPKTNWIVLQQGNLDTNNKKSQETPCPPLIQLWRPHPS